MRQANRLPTDDDRDRQFAAELKQRLEEERLRWKRGVEAERQRLEEERLRLEAERQRLENEQRKVQAETSSRRIASVGNEWFSVLDLPSSASVAEVKRAYRELALLHHPDKSFETCDGTFKRIKEAYQQGLRFARQKVTPEKPCQPGQNGNSASVEKPANSSGSARRSTKILLLSASTDRTVRLWDACTGECERTIWAHSREVTAVSCPSDGKRFVTGGWDRTAKIWELVDATRDANCIATIQSAPSHRSMSIMWKPSVSSCGKYIAIVSQDAVVRVWRTWSGICEKTLRGHTCDVKCASFDPSGDLLITGSVDRTARIWSWKAGMSDHTLRGHQGSVTAACFSFDGLLAATGSDDSSAMLWDASTGKALLKLRGHTGRVNSLCFSLDDSFIATGSEDGNAKVWDTVNGECLQTLGRCGCINAVCLSFDASLLAMALTDHTVKVWCLRTGSCEHVLRKHEGPVVSIAFLTPAGKFRHAG